MATIEMRVDANPEKLAPVLYHCFRNSNDTGWSVLPDWNELEGIRQNFWRRMAHNFIAAYTGIG